ncbi:hypothetical protein U7230_08700 [Carboxydochorda subterranea]|uniref:N-acetyltransferase domain-containing protein n=1 Tax=Carboxydichorda subterranea TaxID=3109565 RepID=A0ABZ1BTP0_9FIRM|nr:hypothetical protein [Limnochorda sp. L945t]WRP16182.1 hypothetical protein U7230_08700 [Limnochorda sp. L945t]
MRPYLPSDRAAVRAICIQTAWAGSSVAERFPDPELFADFLTAYYTDAEPASTWVVEAMEPASDRERPRVVGYLTACLDPARFRRHRLRTAPGMAVRLLAILVRVLVHTLGERLRGVPAPAPGARQLRFLGWLVGRSWREVPQAPPGCGHFHFNILPAWRAAGAGLALVRAMEARALEVARLGRIRGMYGQIAIGESRRSAALFERLGWKLYDSRPFTKYGEPAYGEPAGHAGAPAPPGSRSADGAPAARRMATFWKPLP